MAGVLVALIGVAIVSYAGHQKEEQLGSEVKEFNVKLGLLLAVMCGIFSSGMSFAIDAARPMEAAAKALGVNSLYAALPSYVIIMGGGAIVNLSYCFIRLAALKRLSLRADLGQPRPTLIKNAASGRNRRNHVVPAVLLLRMGRSQHSAATVLRELDAAHEHLRPLRRAGGPGAGRVEGRSQQTGAPALGRSPGHHRRRQSGWTGDGVVATIPTR